MDGVHFVGVNVVLRSCFTAMSGERRWGVVLCLGVKNENDKDYGYITESINAFFMVLLPSLGQFLPSLGQVFASQESSFCECGSSFASFCRCVG